MIDATSSQEAARGLSGGEFAAYLAARGWRSLGSRVEEMLFLSKRFEPSGETAELVLPLDDAGADYNLRIADALRTVAGVEGRDVFAVANEIRRDTLPQLAAPVVAGPAEERG